MLAAIGRAGTGGIERHPSWQDLDHVPPPPQPDPWRNPHAPVGVGSPALAPTPAPAAVPPGPHLAVLVTDFPPDAAQSKTLIDRLPAGVARIARLVDDRFGGGALIVAREDIAKSLKRPLVKVLGMGEAVKGQMGGNVDLTYSGAVVSGKTAFEEAKVKHADIKYASIYDSFTITVLMQLEDLGFCKKGEGGKFVQDGNLISGVGKLPFNTDGGGLCNNHPTNRGGITKVIEAVRQLRGEAHPKVQVPNCDIALAHGTGGSLGTRHGSATLIMERN